MTRTPVEAMCQERKEQGRKKRMKCEVRCEWGTLCSSQDSDKARNAYILEEPGHSFNQVLSLGLGCAWICKGSIRVKVFFSSFFNPDCSSTVQRRDKMSRPRADFVGSRWKGSSRGDTAAGGASHSPCSGGGANNLSVFFSTN